MGCFGKSCYTNPAPQARAPNPSPSRWTYLDHAQFSYGYALKVRYHDCTNYEGVKVMVYRGEYRHPVALDPHFAETSDAPIARFRPDAAGWLMALDLARSLT